MSSRFHKLVALLFFSLCTISVLAAAPLRICADPDNLPFSNRAGAGFDNQIATLIAHDLHRSAVFIWVRPRRGFLREQFNKNACDILLGVPTSMRSVAVTMPYYTSSYVFVTPAREHLQIASFTSDQLNCRRIGLQILEEDLSPPSLPLIRAGHAAQIVGYESFGRQEGDVVRAVATGHVGVAVVWGPVAGYFARRSSTPLTLKPVPPSYKFGGIPFTYSIGFGVHKQDAMLLQQLNHSITKLQPKIYGILASFNVPTVGMSEEAH
jgi:quinoprotein dehydrogenase-associated probable ABC transporter substrate-binding protein